ncbi:MAG: DUF4465 domain-containing protein [Phycisphaerae bacterium]
MKRMERMWMVVLCVLVAAGSASAGSSDFDDLTLEEDSYWNGSDNSGGFTSGDASYNNMFTPEWSTWEGWSYSNMTDNTTPGHGNQYSAFTGGAHTGSNYGIAYAGSCMVSLESEQIVQSAYLTNTTYTGLSMRDGDSFAKRFGGDTGDDPDWLKVTATGRDGEGNVTGTKDIYLADYRYSNNSKDYIVDTWRPVNFGTLGKVKSIEFSMSSSDTGEWGMNTPSYFAMDSLATADTYAPAAGQKGSTAIHKDDDRIVAWATGATVQRGPMDISNPEAGNASYGTADNAVGKASGSSTDVVSLGDGGSAVLTFDHAITNDEGFDFVVYENSFSDTFLELAFVEVSSDGEHFERFDAVSLTQTDTQVGGFGALDPTQIHNFAGKYRQGQGTPFDLEELRGASELLDVDAITHVRIVDVVGSIDDAYATYDVLGNKVNDPWSTPFGSSGFDLDAIGVIHQIPEPATLVLLTIGGLGAIIRRKRSNS